MSTPTFTFVEEYIEFIGGYRTATGKKLGLFEQTPSPINLARYDVNIISSLAAQTADLSKAYTDKQAALALRIVDKYRRQLASLAIPVYVPENVSNLVYKYGIREIDRRKTVTIEDNKFVVKFPYDTKLIDLVKRQLREGQGGAQFDADRKVWSLAMTEHMLNWIMAVCPQNDFEIADDIKELYNKLLSAEQKEYKIELDITGDQVSISNAPASLIEYIERNIGPLTLDNLCLLVDNSEVLGYTVSPAVKEVIKHQYPEFGKMICKRKATFKDKEDIVNKIVEYARLVNRLPIHMYETGLPKTSTDEIIYMNRGMSYDLKPKLLVTTTGLMIGSRKESWTTNAEKIFIIE